MAKKGTTGFIGGGMMASAIIAGMIRQMGTAPESIYVSECNAARCRELAEEFGVHASVGAAEFADKVDVMILAVKPQAAAAAMAEIVPLVRPDTLLASIVAGLKLASLEQAFPNSPIVRIMPNTPLAVGEGMSAYALNEKAKATDVSAVADILAACGRAVKVEEAMMDAVTGLSGSGPAYGFLMIDALSDGGVMAGLPRQTATLLAAQTVLGAAKMVLATARHPDALRDQVTSPAGTTMAGVRVLEQRGFRGALIDAVLAAADRSAALGKTK